MKTIEFDQQCPACGGTGLYQGMGERPPYGVVCKRCSGTGKYHFIHSYEEFTERKVHPKVKYVLRTNPGIGVGPGPTPEGRKFSPEDWGAIPYEDWAQGNGFPKGSEMREFTCPAWYYQCCDYDKKPNWAQCACCGSFSGCKHFDNKEACWARFDKEQE